MCSDCDWLKGTIFVRKQNVRIFYTHCINSSSSTGIYVYIFIPTIHLLIFEMARVRNPRFSNIEVEVLIHECNKKLSLLRNGDNGERIKKSKEDAWKDITMKVNAVNTSGKARLPKECKKKWFDLKSRTKAKVATNNKERAKTGGGTSAEVDLTAVDRVLVGSFVNEEIHGIQGGFESGIRHTSDQDNESSGVRSLFHDFLFTINFSLRTALKLKINNNRA